MSFKLPAQATKAGAPTAADDATKGFVVGSALIDTSVSPRQVYICTSAAAGAATWANAGGISSHPSLSTLGWSASGHTGTQTSVAAFNGAGAAQTVQATEEGSVLTLVGGVLTFVVMAATAGVINNSARSIEIEYVSTIGDTPDDAGTGPGSFL